MSIEETTLALSHILQEPLSRELLANRAAERIAAARNYRWVGLYEVTSAEIIVIVCSGPAVPYIPRFPVSRGLCGVAVSSKSMVNVGNVRMDPRWITTFGACRSEIAVPIPSDDSHVVGLLDVESDILDAFTSSDEQFLSACAPALLRLFL